MYLLYTQFEFHILCNADYLHKEIMILHSVTGGCFKIHRKNFKCETDLKNGKNNCCQDDSVLCLEILDNEKFLDFLLFNKYT